MSIKDIAPRRVNVEGADSYGELFAFWVTFTDGSRKSVPPHEMVEWRYLTKSQRAFVVAQIAE